MGNASYPQQSNQTQGHQYPLSKNKNKFSRFAVYSDSQLNQYIGHEIELPQSGQLMILQELEQKRRKKVQSILQIEKQYFRKNSTVCSQQQKCLLLSRKPQSSLLELMRSKKHSGGSFRVSEISRLIKRIALALESEKDSMIMSLDLQSIVYLEGQVYVIDGLMMGGDGFGYNLKGLYPAPESFSQYYKYDQDIRHIDSQFFCLGMIALSMVIMKERIDQIYQKNTSIGFSRLFNNEKLNQLISKVKSQKLKKKIQVLTALNPKIRKNILNIIHNQQNQKQNIVFNKQNEIINSRIIIQNLQNSRKIQHSRIIKQNNLPLSNKYSILPFQRKILNENININFTFANNTINRNPSITSLQIPEPQIIIHSPKLQKPLNQNKNQHSQIKQPNKLITNANLLKVQSSIETPPRNKTKNHFSTIKQVSEYQQCFTEGNLTEFQQKISEKTTEGRYEGKLVRGMKQGFGKYYYTEGGRYQGEWKQDRMNGFGKLYYPSGMLAFQGYMINDQFHGSGKAYNNSFKVLQEGVNFQDFNNLEEIWITYQGQFDHDCKQGWGIMTFANGQLFEGHFANDMMEGYGTFYSPKKGTVIGIWKMSKFQNSEAEKL